MLFAIYCTDKPDAAAVRAANRPAHLDYIRANIDRVVTAGPLQSLDAQAMVGSLLIVDFADLDAARAFADGDPYSKAGLFESVVIRPWKKVFPEA